MVKIFDLKLSDIPDGYSAGEYGILATNTSISIFSDDPLIIEPVLNEQIPAWVEAYNTDPTTADSYGTTDMDSLFNDGARVRNIASVESMAFLDSDHGYSYYDTKLHIYETDEIVTLCGTTGDYIQGTYYMGVMAYNAVEDKYKYCWGKATVDFDTSIQFIIGRNDIYVDLLAKLTKYPDVTTSNFKYYFSNSNPDTDPNGKSNSEPIINSSITGNYDGTDTIVPNYYNVGHIYVDDFSPYTITISNDENNPSYVIGTETLNPGTATEEEVILGSTPVGINVT